MLIIIDDSRDANRSDADRSDIESFSFKKPIIFDALWHPDQPVEAIYESRIDRHFFGTSR